MSARKKDGENSVEAGPNSFGEERPLPFPMKGARIRINW